MRATPTRALCRAIAETFPDRPVRLEFWDGSRLEPTRPGPTLHVRSPAVLADLVRAPGQLGLVRAYVRGDLGISDLDAVVEVAGSWQAPRLGAFTRVKLLAAAARAAGARRPPPPPEAELRPKGRVHGRVRDARAVRHHYELPPELFALFLDASMTYSCALFAHADMTLEEAQHAKLELVCRKLELHSGCEVLDVGCGWGSFALHAAREHGAHVLGITLSESQARHARELARAERLDGLTEFRVLDYRELGHRRFDAISSIGMVEHVGHRNLATYARCLAQALRPGGRLLNHGIAWARPGRYAIGAFNQRYVFPDGDLPHLHEMLAALEEAGLEPLQVESLRHDYAETMRHWTERLDERLDEAIALVGEERVRVWRLYLRASRYGFVIGNCSVFQTLATAGRARGLSPWESRPESSGRPLQLSGGQS